MTYVSVFLCFWRKIFKFIHGSDDCHWLCLKWLHFLPLLFLLITCIMVTARTVQSCFFNITSWDRLVDHQPYYSNPTDFATPTTCCFIFFSTDSTPFSGVHTYILVLWCQDFTNGLSSCEVLQSKCSFHFSSTSCMLHVHQSHYDLNIHTILAHKVLQNCKLR